MLFKGLNNGQRQAVITSEGEIMLFKGLNNGQRQAVITKVCVAGRSFLPGTTDEEILQRVLRGDLEIVVQKTEQILFDRHGRRIPPRGLIEAVCDPDYNFRLNQPDLDYASRLVRLNEVGLKVDISADEFQARSEAILATVSGNEQIKNLLNGVYLPLVIIPKMNIADLGEATEKLVEAAGVSYRRQFPDRQFINHRKGELGGQVAIVPGSRYEKLLAGMAQGAVVGIYFPACLQGFSVHAQREQVQTLSEDFILSGPVESSIAWAMYPDILGRDFNTPGYDCSAVQWRKADYSLYFRACDVSTDFDDRASLGLADGHYSGGLLLLG